MRLTAFCHPMTQMIRVRLNGEDVIACREADTVAGWVDLYVRVGGSHAYKRAADGESFELQRVFGVVSASIDGGRTWLTGAEIDAALALWDRDTYGLTQH